MGEYVRTADLDGWWLPSDHQLESADRVALRANVDRICMICGCFESLTIQSEEPARG